MLKKLLCLFFLLMMATSVDAAIMVNVHAAGSRVVMPDGTSVDVDSSGRASVTTAYISEMRLRGFVIDTTVATMAQQNAGAAAAVMVDANGYLLDGTGAKMPVVRTPRYKLVLSRGMINGINSDSGGTNTTVNCNVSLLRPTTPFAFSSPRIIFTHWGAAGTSTDEYFPSPSTTLTITASMTASGVTRQAMFGGATSVALAPGGTVATDPFPIDVAANASAGSVSMRYFLSTTSTNKWARGGLQVFTSLGDACAEGVGTADVTMGGTITNGQGAEYGFTGVVGLTATPKLAIAGAGDSILQGQGDDATGVATFGSTTGNGNGAWGWLGRAAYNLGIPFLQLSRSGDQASFQQPPYNYRRNLVSLFSVGPIVDWVFPCVGTNDATNGRSYAQLKADLTSIYAFWHARGVKVIACTITPKTTSTDSWATVANQTLATNHTLTDAPALVNADFRGGNLYGADALFDAAAQVESATASQIWKAGYTSDGLHPNQTGHLAIDAAAETFLQTLAPL